MKCKIVDCDEGVINKFLATPGIKILTKHVLPPDEGCSDTMVLFFFDTAEDDAAAKDRAFLEANDQMDRLMETARQVVQDSHFSGLKNNTQKEIYLFAKYNLTKSDAGVVVELLKPEMKVVLGA